MRGKKLFLLGSLLVLWSFSGYAEEIHSGETKVNQNISGPPYYQLWTFDGVQNDGVIINAVKTSGNLDTAIDLYDPYGSLEVQGWQTGSGGDVLEHRLKKTGSYTIWIKDYGLNDTGTYNLTLLKFPTPGDPNGGAIASGQTLSARSIAHASDIEGFQFHGATGEGIIVNAVKTSGDLDTAIDLFAPDGTLETRGWQTGSGGDTLEHHPLSQTGVYTIVIKDYGLDQTGVYNLTFLKILGAVSHLTDSDGGALAPGQTINPAGTINVASDIDAFQFYGEQTVDHVIINAITLSGTLDTAIDLFAPDGSLEVRGWQTGSGGDTLDHWVSQTGLYTIVIKDYGLDQTGTFWVSMTKFPTTVNPGLYNPSPANGASLNNLSGSFSWNAVTGATGYDLYFGENVITPLQKIGTNLTSPVMAFPALQSGKVYYWHVVAHTATGDIQGPYWWFKTEPAAYLLWTK